MSEILHEDLNTYDILINNLRTIYKKGQRSAYQGSEFKIIGIKDEVLDTFPEEYTYYDEEVGLAVSIVLINNDYFTLTIEPLSDSRIYIDLTEDIAMYVMRVDVRVKDGEILYFVGKEQQYGVTFKDSSFEDWLIEWSQKQSNIEIPKDVIANEPSTAKLLQSLRDKFNTAFNKDSQVYPYLEQIELADDNSQIHFMLEGLVDNQKIIADIVVTNIYANEDCVIPDDQIEAQIALEIDNSDVVKFATTRDGIMYADNPLYLAIEAGVGLFMITEVDDEIIYTPLDVDTVNSIYRILNKLSPAVIPFKSNR